MNIKNIQLLFFDNKQKELFIIIYFDNKKNIIKEYYSSSYKNIDIILNIFKNKFFLKKRIKKFLESSYFLKKE